jgi:hypothetical protein
MLSQQEFELIHNSDILRLKASAIHKVRQMLLDFEQTIIENNIEERFNKLFLKNSAPSKISRGENYLGLPYLILDYPAYFSKQSIAAFRTLFWWGNFFSFTLHLQGEALEYVRNQLVQNSLKIHGSDFHICMNESPWEYHYQNSNYRLCSEFKRDELENHLKNFPFVKLSYKLSLSKYKALGQKGLDIQLQMLSFLC